MANEIEIKANEAREQLAQAEATLSGAVEFLRAAESSSGPNLVAAIAAVQAALPELAQAVTVAQETVEALEWLEVAQGWADNSEQGADRYRVAIRRDIAAAQAKCLTDGAQAITGQALAMLQ